MFDGLKDRLSSFRDDAEEEIDDAAAEADEADEAAAAAGTDETVAEPETTTAEPEAASEPEPAVEDEPTLDGTEPEAAESEPSPLGAGTDASAADPAEPKESEESVDSETTDEPAEASSDASASSDLDTNESGSGAAASGTVEPGTGEETNDDAEPERRRTRLNRPTTVPDEDESAGEDEDLGFGTRAKLFATGQSLIEAAELEGPLFELEMALLESDVEMTVTEAILDRLREELTGATRAQVKGTGTVVEEALAESLREVISVGQFDFDQRIAEADKPVTIVFTGVNGVGKTTSIAKLARYFEERGLSTVLANGDTYRAGANQQLAEHAENLGKKVIAHDQGSDPAAVLYDAVEYAEANDIDVVLGDTAGRLHTSNDLMAQLEKIDRVVDPDMTIFVDEAVAGQDATNRAREFDDAATIDGTILAKADADSQGGAAISIAHVTGKPILFLGTGQGYDDIERFEPDVLVDRLLGDDD
ncbi:signal recognition particle-docking protein FtsY [Halococcus hamelinensis]|uniref:Signal recognition particle receptor FtsY n=1 Tax=Halococcus hamelinensis 100A6 TaxID=1132509 RepID=M0M4T7_9EURY|nr:signal recognition particle-docking protein FtsY [Halococcus hamelinensis]EMA40827.1 cell division protein FtsY [Halococcus hamelinensis 100A6]